MKVRWRWMILSKVYVGTSYEVLSHAKISANRNAVVSKCSRGGFTLAQQLEAVDGDVVDRVYMRGALHIAGVEELIALRDALDEAISKSSDNSQ